MAEHEFKLDTRFSDAPSPYLRPAATVVAVLGIIGILLTMTTNVASRVLPMEDRYLQALVPQAPDGGLPLSLQVLRHQEPADKALTLEGSVVNRSSYSITDLEAVIQIQDRFGFTKQTVTVPVEPREIPTQGTGTFQTSIPLAEPPLSSYSVKFQILDGPFVPHKDDRTAAVDVK